MKLILLILLLSFIVLFWQLGVVPRGVLVDEAAVGYNAYSLLKTGRDEWGDRLPLTLRSFGDYKTSGYVYLSIPFIKLLGLSPFSIRLPSAISGVITVFLLYLAVKLLTKNNTLALISSFLLAISPWHIYMNRMVWDQNISIVLFLAGLVFFLYRFKNLIFTTFSALFFSLTLNVYAGYKILTPLFILFLLYFYYHKKIIKIKTIFYFLLFFSIFSSPLIYEVFFRGGATRFSQVSIFKQIGDTMYIDEKRAFCGMSDQKTILPFCYLIWNKPTVILGNFLKNYLTSISGDFLFLTGDTSAHINNPDHGGLYFWLYPLFIIGIIFLIRHINKSSYQFILLWFLLSPIMSSLADKPQFSRAYMILIPVVIICGLGFFAVIEKVRFKSNFIKSSIIYIFVLVSLLSVFITMIDYLLIYTKKASAWEDYYIDIYKYIAEIEKEYTNIYIQKFNKHPYIYMLFFLSYEPQKFQNQVVREGFEVLSIEKYKFTDNDFSFIYCGWLKENKPNTLFITNYYNEQLDPLFIVRSFNKVHVQAAIYDMERTQKFLSIKQLDLIQCR